VWIVVCKGGFPFYKRRVAKYFLVGCKQHHQASAGVRVKDFHTVSKRGEAKFWWG
jgi:hypothetical protein